MIVVINKMDLCEWGQERFDECKDKLIPFLKKTGFNPKAVQFMPISGQQGDGLIEEVGDKCPWSVSPHPK